MNSIISFAKKAFNGNSLLHGLAMTLLTAVGVPITSYITAWVNSNPVPDFHTIFISTLKIAIGAGLAYLVKNGIFGTSAPTLGVSK